MSDDITKNVQAYLDGDLSDQEREVFEKELSTNKALQNELEIQKDFIAVLQSKEDIKLKKELLKDWQNIKSFPPEEQLNTTIKAKEKSLVFYLSRIAAIGLLLIGSWWIYHSFSKDTSADLLATQFLDEKYNAPTYTKNKLEELDENWKNAIGFYQKEQYKETGLAIEQIVAQGTETKEQQFYLGLSYLYQQEPNLDKAISYFQKLLNPNSLFKEQAHWFIALAHLKNKDNAQAKQYFEKIINSNFWKKEEAKKILEKI